MNTAEVSVYKCVQQYAVFFTKIKHDKNVGLKLEHIQATRDFFHFKLTP